MRDWRDIEIVSNPRFLPLLIMTDEEIMVYHCSGCGERTSYPTRRAMRMYGVVTDADVNFA